MGKSSSPMHQDNHRVFAEPSEAHAKVITSLVKRGYTVTMIAKASGLSETEIRKIIQERGIKAW